MSKAHDHNEHSHDEHSHDEHKHSHKKHSHHGHSHSHHHHSGSEKNIRMAFILNFTFTILEIIGGIWTNSMAILSDALHDLGDSLSLGAAWYLQRRSKQGRDNRFSFGYARFSLLGALISSIVLVVGSVLILVRTVPRIINPEPVEPVGMLAFAVLGIVVNGAAMLRLRKGSSLNEKVVSWHLLEDMLGWVAVLVASIVLMFVDIPIIDPLLSLAITIYVLYNVFKNLKEIFMVFLQGVPSSHSIEEIEQEISTQIKDVSVHHTHIWSLDGEKTMMSTHVAFNNDTERQTIIDAKNKIREISKAMDIYHVTIQVDFEEEDCDDTDC